MRNPGFRFDFPDFASLNPGYTAAGNGDGRGSE
jgi:hypothetical protein